MFSHEICEVELKKSSAPGHVTRLEIVQCLPVEIKIRATATSQSSLHG